MREETYDKNGFINKLNGELLWTNSYYLHRVDEKGRRIYIYHRDLQGLNFTDKMLMNIEKENGDKKFREMSLLERRKWLSEKLEIDYNKLDTLLSTGGISEEQQNLMIENCIGGIKIPLGLA